MNRCFERRRGGSWGHPALAVAASSTLHAVPDGFTILDGAVEPELFVTNGEILRCSNRASRPDDAS